VIYFITFEHYANIKTPNINVGGGNNIATHYGSQP
jgi:hypothetical protein